MKRPVFNKIPTGVLWFCTLITLILSVGFYYAYFNQSVDTESTELSALLIWLFTLFIITVGIGLIFSFFYLIRRWKEDPKKMIRSAVITLVSGLLLLVTWILGSGNPLPLIGYKGNENTYVWLKLTDMWLYSIYILLGIGLLALFGGIIWSYLKKGN